MSGSEGSALRLEPVFRETILWRFGDPAHIETLRRFGDLAEVLSPASDEGG